MTPVTMASASPSDFRGGKMVAVLVHETLDALQEAVALQPLVEKAGEALRCDAAR